MGNEQKHTPGPWELTEYASEIVVRSGFTECALVRRIMHGDNPTGQRAEQIANARLIASAPALRAENERLREALKEIAHMTDGATGGMHGEISDIARAALNGGGK